MKLLYITNSRIPTEKAHGLQIIKTIESLEKIGISVTLFVPNRKNHIRTNIDDFYNIKSEIKRVVKVFDIVRPVQYISERIYFPMQRLWFVIATCLYALLWRDVIYSRDITVSYLLSLFGKNVVYEDHQPRQRFKLLYKFFLKNISKKVIVAHNLVAEYKAMGIPENSYEYVPNGVDVSEFDAVVPDKTVWSKKFNIENDNKIALYVGHFYKWKGVYTLLHATKDIQAKVVLIGGTIEDNKEINEYIKNHLIPNVYVHPFVVHNKIIQYIKSADVLVLPNTATQERSNKYTTPIKLFEYMASGVPIVSSNLPSFASYLTHMHNALMFKPDNPQDLAKQTNVILQDKELARTLAGNARHESQQYDWNKRSKKIISFIKT